jgi:hypothetical protein
VAAAARARRWNFFMSISYRLGRLAIDLTFQVKISCYDLMCQVVCDT